MTAALAIARAELAIARRSRLLLAAIAIPSYWIIRLALAVLVGHYQMMTTLNGLPFP